MLGSKFRKPQTSDLKPSSCSQVTQVSLFALVTSHLPYNVHILWEASASKMPDKHWGCALLNIHTNNGLGERIRRRGRQTAGTGEKDPAEHLLTVARCYSRGNVKRQRSFVVTTQADRPKAFSLQPEHLSSYHSSIGSSFDNQGRGWLCFEIAPIALLVLPPSALRHPSN
jgi:hypothetical protein